MLGVLALLPSDEHLGFGPEVIYVDTVPTCLDDLALFQHLLGVKLAVLLLLLGLTGVDEVLHNVIAALLIHAVFSDGLLDFRILWEGQSHHF